MIKADILMLSKLDLVGIVNDQYKEIEAISKDRDYYKEQVIKLQEMVKDGLPENCIEDWSSVKFCTNRQGEGNICKKCLHF